MNLIAKMSCTLLYYIFKLSYTIKTSCEEPTPLLWYATFLVAFRLLGMSQCTTFLFMSFAKVILSWRAGLFMSLNSKTSVNIATVVGVSIIIIDMGLRKDIPILNDCTENRLLKMYHYMFKSEMCYVQTYNESVEFHSTLFENNECKDKLLLNIYQIMYKSEMCYVKTYNQSVESNSNQCIDYPTIKVIICCIFIFELMKVIMEFLRMIKKFKRKYKQFVFANLLNQPISVDAIQLKSTDIELSKMNSTIPIRENIQKQKEDLEHTHNLPSSSSSISKALSAPILNPLESEQHRFCDI